jgi:ubiquinone/menaquinone biosynthesis C-methylase UbiE
MTKTIRNNAKSYNDPKHNYLKYWDKRSYEHDAEEMAINRLIKGMHFKQAVDVGGGYGRLSKFLTKYSDKVVLAEPSDQQHDIAKEFLKDTPTVEQRIVQASDLGMPDNFADLVLVVRVLHHIPEPSPEFGEIARVLKSDGYFLLEFANNAHFLNRLRYASKGKKIPNDPVDIRTELSKNDPNSLPFVNHNPKTIIAQLDKAGFDLVKVLSGSNLRSTRLKKIMPKKAMLALEWVMQPTLASVKFGPSVWFLLKKR